MKFIKQDNSVVPNSGDDGCLMVSQYESDPNSSIGRTVNLLASATFDGPPQQLPEDVPDLRTYRVELRHLSDSDPVLKLEIIRKSQCVYSEMFNMVSSNESGEIIYRTNQHFRLVSTIMDDAIQGKQTPKLQLGDIVRASILVGQAVKGFTELQVGRPATETGINAIRTASCHFIVLDHADVKTKASVDGVVQNLNEMWGQCGVRFKKKTSVIKAPVKNILSVRKMATGSGSVTVTIDGQVIGPIDVGMNGRTDTIEIAEDIAAGINNVVGNGTAFGLKVRPDASPDFLAEVVVKKGQSVTFTQLQSTVPTTLIQVPGYDPNHDTIVTGDWSDDEWACLMANFGDSDPDTIDILIAKWADHPGIAWPVYYGGIGSGVKNSLVLQLNGVSDGSGYGPQWTTSGHEVGHILLNVADGHPEYGSLMVGHERRLTMLSQQRSRSESSNILKAE